METIKELYRQHRILFPTFRNLQLRHSKNLLNNQELMDLNKIELQLNEININIKNAEQELIRRKFGQEILEEWNYLKELSSSPFESRSEIGQKIIELTNRLKEVEDLILSTKL
jgi:septin family protein